MIPIVYNERRLLELPRPEIQPDVDQNAQQDEENGHNDEADDEANGTLVELPNVNIEHEVDQNVQQDEANGHNAGADDEANGTLVELPNVNIEHEVDQNKNHSNAQNNEEGESNEDVENNCASNSLPISLETTGHPAKNAVKLEYVPLFAPRRSTIDDVGQILFEPEYEITVIDGIEMKSVKGMQVKPLQSTTDGLIKREYDIISGDIPFNESVS